MAFSISYGFTINIFKRNYKIFPFFCFVSPVSHFLSPAVFETSPSDIKFCLFSSLVPIQMIPLVNFSGSD